MENECDGDWAKPGIVTLLQTIPFLFHFRELPVVLWFVPQRWPSQGTESHTHTRTGSSKISFIMLCEEILRRRQLREASGGVAFFCFAAFTVPRTHKLPPAGSIGGVLRRLDFDD